MPHVTRLRALAAALVCVGLAAFGQQPVGAEAATPASSGLGPVTVIRTSAHAKPCRAGLVALTFDDGPRPGTTPRLVRELRGLDVPATFFEMGNHITAHPNLVRLVSRSGFAIANHSWDHPSLPMLSNRAVRKEIAATDRALRRLGVTPAPLMRPPYGAMTARVRALIRSLGFTPTLWTIDSNDWRGGNARQIAGRVLAALRPHQHNVVLQHDGVTNSPASVAAVPIIVQRARARGFCFTGLGPHGHPRLADPTTVITTRYVGSRTGDSVRIRIQLSSPAVRPASLHVRAANLTARAGADYRRLDRMIGLPRGTRSATIVVPVNRPAIGAPVQRFRLFLSQPDAVGLTARSVDVLIARPGLHLVQPAKRSSPDSTS